MSRNTARLLQAFVGLVLPVAILWIVIYALRSIGASNEQVAWVVSTLLAWSIAIAVFDRDGKWNRVFGPHIPEPRVTQEWEDLFLPLETSEVERLARTCNEIPELEQIVANWVRSGVLRKREFMLIMVGAQDYRAYKAHEWLEGLAASAVNDKDSTRTVPDVNTATP